MNIKKLFFFSLIFFFCFTSVALSQTLTKSIPFITLDQGDISFYSYDIANFNGLDMLIKDKRTWEQFWKKHTSGLEPAPELPFVNFAKEMVIVTVLGYQTSGGGPSTQVLNVNFERERSRISNLHVYIEDNEIPGPLDVITNPFHIIKIKRIYTRSIAFEHQEPIPPIQ